MLGGDGGIVMLKTAFVVLAMLALSACATVAPVDMLDRAAPVQKPADAGPLETAIVLADAIVAAECAIETPREVATVASPVLSRRGFGHPTRNQPDQRLVLATAADRARFHRGRRRQRRA
jgi:hypothetical protein